MNFSRTRAGFTLVELMTAITAYSMLVIVAGVTVVALHRDLHRSRADLEAQRDFSVTRRRLEHAVRPASRPQVVATAGRLDVLTSSGTVSFVREGASLVQYTAGGDAGTLVAGRLLQFDASVSNFTVTVTLAVRGETETNRVTERIAYRNVP